MVGEKSTRRGFLHTAIVGTSSICVVGGRVSGQPRAPRLSPLQQQINGNTGFVLLTFDHAKPSVYETALPITQEFNYPALLSVVADRISSARGDLLTADQLSELHTNGWEIGSHSMGDHPDFMELSAEEIAKQCEESKQWLRNHDFGEESATIVYPYEKVDDRVADVAQQYFQIGFGGSREPGASIIDPLRIGRVNGDDVEATKQAIDAAARQGQVLAIMYHTVGADDGRIDTPSFRETMERIQNKGDALQVITPSTLDGLLAGEQFGTERTETSSSTTGTPDRTNDTRRKKEPSSTTTETTSQATAGSSSVPSTESEVTTSRERNRTSEEATERTSTEGPGFGVLAALGGLASWTVYRLSNGSDDDQ